MNLMTSKSTVTHFHLYCGSGFGAFGMQEASARVGTLDAEMECLGGVDVDPVACQDFERINGVPAACLDLFDREQFKSWHSGCRSGRKCKVCFNTGEPPAGWREVTPEDIRLAAQGRHPNIVFASPPCKGLSGLQSPKRAESIGSSGSESAGQGAQDRLPDIGSLRRGELGRDRERRDRPWPARQRPLLRR